MLNSVNLIGNLGADPELNYLPSGTAVAKFRLAVNERYKDQNGEKQEKTYWISCVAWAGVAEVMGNYCSKGSRIGITGKLTSRTWEKDDGSKGYATEVVVQNLELLGSNQQNGQSQGQQQSSHGQGQQGNRSQGQQNSQQRGNSQRSNGNQQRGNSGWGHEDPNKPSNLPPPSNYVPDEDIPF